MPVAAQDVPSAGDRANNFDFLRFFLAATVVWSHSFYVLGLPARSGTLAVLGFFGISGFLVTQSWQRRRSVWDFVRRRALRIWPGFAAVVLFDHLVVAPIATGTGLAWLARLDPGQIARDVVLLQHLGIPGVFTDLPVRAVNGSLWSIPYEVLCYTLLAVLGLAGVVARRGLLVAVLAGALALHGALPALPRLHGELRTVAMVLPFVTAFLAGAVVRVHRDRLDAAPWQIALLLLVMAVATWSRKVVGFVWPIGLPVVLLWLAHHPRLPLRGFGRHGDFSYGLYLFAFPVQQLLVHFGGTDLHPYLLFVAAMLLTMPLAAASWFLVERPFLRLKDARAPRPVDGTDPALALRR